MTKKTKLYNVTKEKENIILINSLYEFIIYMFAYSIVILIASKIFKGFYISNFGYAFLGACVISLLDSFLKIPLQIITLPITILSYGILYPLTNMIILYLTHVILGNNFVLGGFLSTFFLSIFIAILKYIVDKSFVEPIIEGKRK